MPDAWGCARGGRWTAVLGVALAAPALGQAPCPGPCGTPVPLARGVVIEGVPAAQAVFDEDGPGGAPARLFVAGGFLRAGGVEASNIVRWDGESWSALGAGLGGGEVRALAVFDGGSGARLYAAGRFDSAGGLPAQGLARWDGNAWEAAPPPPEQLDGSFRFGTVHRLAVLPTPAGAELYAAVGYSDTVCALVQVYRFTGAGWAAVGERIGSETATGLTAFDPDGAGPLPARLYMTTQSGSTHSCGGFVGRFLRLEGGGWQSLASGELVMYNAVGVSEAGGQARLYIAGSFDAIGGVGAANIASFDGTDFAPLGAGVEGPVYELAHFDTDGDGAGMGLLAAAGSIMRAGGLPAAGLAFWTGLGWEAPASGGLGYSGAGSILDSIALRPFDPDGAGPANPLLAAAGPLVSAGGQAVAGFAAYGGHWIGPARGPSGPVHALAMYNDGQGRELFVGGSFLRAGESAAYNLARWDGAGWSVGGAFGGGPVLALVPFSDALGHALYAGGEFTTEGGGTRLRIARFGPPNWSWSPVGGGMDAAVRALESFDPDGAGPLPASLYAGGNFTSAGGAAAARVARWDGTSWAALGSGLDGTVYALRGFDDGTGPALYAGGIFQHAGGAPAPYAARWDGASWQGLPGMNATGGGLIGVRAFGVFDAGNGPRLYVGGRFYVNGAQTVLARWEGGALVRVPPPAGWVDSYVSSLRVFDDGTGPKLFVGGLRTAGVHGQLFTFDGGSWGVYGPHLDGTITSLSVPFDLGCGRALYAGGTFTRIGGVEPATRVLRVAPCAGGCYANCDGSAAAPVLNIADFTCFLQRFAAGDAYANCDQSTGAPVLNIADFTCFLQAFAAGCP